MNNSIPSDDGGDRDDASCVAAASSVCNEDELADNNLSSNISLGQLAQNVSAVMEKGGDANELYSILHISMGGDESTNTNQAEGESTSSHIQESGGNSDKTENYRCRQLLSVFLTLIGNDNDVCKIGGLDIPLSVRAHLLLRALLRIPHDKYSIQW